jgi:RNA polymerase sigma-70 factor (ECF subfamily)
MASGHLAVETTDFDLAPRRFRRTAEDDAEQQEIAMARAVVRAKQGDMEALRFIYVRCADRVYGYVRSIVRDQYEAEDVTQHVFAKLMVVLPKYEQRESTFMAWLLRVARNAALDHLRQRRPTVCEDVGEYDDAPRAPDMISALSVRDALASLPVEQREVVLMRHVLGLSPGEIARRLGRSEPSVHGLHHRGRGTLRALLADMGAAPAVMAS